METMICNCCGAKLVPTTLTPFLTCEYCDTSIPNPHYDAAAATAVAEAAEKPVLQDVCLSALREMGTAQNLIALDRSCFGDPLNGIDAARAGLAIPDDQQVYFLYEHTFLFIAFSDGLALTDGGLYYSCDNGKGSLSWEAFVTAPISCVDHADDADGTLKIGSSVELAVKDEKDSRLARFLVDFHNHVYQQHTGETAPATWAVTEPVTAASAAVQEEGGSLLGSMLPGIGAVLGSAILGGNTPRRTTARTSSILHTPTVHPVNRPTVRQDRHEHMTPPRPLNVPTHHRPARHAEQSDTTRQTNARPGNNNRPAFGQPGRVDVKRKPAFPDRPGGAAAQRKPASPARPGGAAPAF